MTDSRLKSLADRIERLMDERDGIQSDIRDIYAEAKSAGYVPKVLRKAITRKRMDPSKRDEEDTILDLYEGELSGPMRKAVAMAAKGASARQIEAETGIDQATVSRSVSLNKKSETPIVSNSVTFDPSVPSTPTETGELRDALNLAPDSAPERTQNERPAAAIADGEAVDVAIDARAASGSPTLSSASPSKAIGEVSLNPVKAIGGDNEAGDLSKLQVNRHFDLNESPAEGEKSVTPAGGSHDSGLTAESEVARVVPPTPLPPSEAAIGRRSSPKPISDEQAMDAMLAAHARLQASKRERECV